MPGTRLIIEVPEELDERQQYELRTMFGDAFHEFATGPRGDACKYVEDKAARLRNGFDGMAAGQTFEDKVSQVKRRVALAKLLHGPALNVRVEPVRFPMPVYMYYRTCGAHELSAATVLLHLLPATSPGDRGEWMVHEGEDGLEVYAPKGDVFFRWHGETWERVP